MSNFQIGSIRIYESSPDASAKLFFIKNLKTKKHIFLSKSL